MERVRLVNWCIERSSERLNEKWLVRTGQGIYKELLNEMHRPQLDTCLTIADAINAVSASHDRPIPYHLIDVEIDKEDGRIHKYAPVHDDWEDVEDIPILAKIAGEIRVVSVIVREQELPMGSFLNKARCSLLLDKSFVTQGTSKKPHDVAERLTRETGVHPVRLAVSEQHRRRRSTQSLSGRETLEFLKAHASRTGKDRDTLTVYKLHMNKHFARVALMVICAEILTKQQRTWSNYEPWWSEMGYVFMPNPFFRFIFFTDSTQADACPLERLFFEQYYSVPCEIGGYSASNATNVTHVFSRMVPSKDQSPMDVDGEATMALSPDQSCKKGKKRQYVRYKIEGRDCLLPLQGSAVAMEKKALDASEGNIAVFDYTMFYPHVMSVAAKSPAYSRRVSHMAASLAIIPGLKKLYVKELGILALVRQPLYNRMHALALAILRSLVHACKQIGLGLITTQTDSVTVHVPPAVMQANGGSLEQVASTLQQIVRAHHPAFLSELKLERQGTSMIFYNSHKHILYDGEQVVHRTGINAKTFCPAMSKSIQEATEHRTQALELLCSGQPDASLEGYNTALRTFVSDKLREHAVEKADLVCKSYSLPMPLLAHILHVKPGDDGLFTTVPPFYLTLSQYRADNALTMPTIEAFMSSLHQTSGINSKHLDPEKMKRTLTAIYTENTGQMIRWRLVFEELIEYFAMKTVSFLSGGRLVP